MSDQIKCNRTVCSNVGLHVHKFNGKKYCNECVFLIEENIELFGDEPCFDISRDKARQNRIYDRVIDPEHEPPNQWRENKTLTIGAAALATALSWDIGKFNHPKSNRVSNKKQVERKKRTAKKKQAAKQRRRNRKGKL